MPNSKYTNNAYQTAVQNMQQADAADSNLYAALTKQMLAGKQHQEALKTKGQQQSNLAAQQDQQKQSALNMLEDKAKNNPDYDYAVEGASVKKHRPDISPMYEIRKQGLDDRESQALSKQYENKAGFISTLKDLENLTNRDGQGGVMTNPSATMVSAGKVMSGVPTGALGIAEMTGAVPKGTTEERKAVERLRLEYGKATAGMRQSDALRKQEAAAMGMISSGDPDLTSKGIRALARTVQTSVQATQSGFRPEILDRVHSTFGNPMDDLSHVYNDKPMGMQQQGAPQPKPQGGLQDLLQPKSPSSAAAPQSTQTDPSDQKAMQWLQANPQHPSAGAVAQKLKAKGLMQ